MPSNNMNIVFLKSVFNSNIEEVLEMIPDANVNYTNEKGKSALILCSFGSRKHDYKIAELLIEHGADINHVDNNGKTPISEAISNYSGESKHMINLLIDNGAIITEKQLAQIKKEEEACKVFNWSTYVYNDEDESAN